MMLAAEVVWTHDQGTAERSTSLDGSSETLRYMPDSGAEVQGSGW
jgi:hypothetical protein